MSVLTLGGGEVEVSPGVYAPARFQLALGGEQVAQEVAGEQVPDWVDPELIAVYDVEADGRVTLDELHVYRRGDRPISPHYIVTERLEDRAIEALSRHLRVAETSGAVPVDVDPLTLHIDWRQVEARKRAAERGLGGGRGRPRVSEATVRRSAEAYRQATSDAPVAEAAEACGISEATLRRHLRAARERGIDAGPDRRQTRAKRHDQLVREAAKIVLSLAPGEPLGRGLAEAQDISEPNAWKRIRQARERGLLPPAGSGDRKHDDAESEAETTTKAGGPSRTTKGRGRA